MESKTFDLFIPPDITTICHTFYDDIIYWTLKDDELQLFHDARQNRKIKLDSQPKFEMNGISFAVHLYPKFLLRYGSNGTIICTRLAVSWKRSTSFQDNIRFGAVYVVLFCHELNVEFRHLVTIGSKGSNICGMYDYGLRYADIENGKFDEITFGCYVELLSVEYKPDPNKIPDGLIECKNCNRYYKKSDIAQNKHEMTAIPSQVLYASLYVYTCNDCNSNSNGDFEERLQPILPIDVSVPEPYIRRLSMDREFEYEWVLNKEEITLFKNAEVDFSLYSPNFNHDTFCVVTAPNGLTIRGGTKGFVLQKIKLLKLPYGVMGVLCHYKLELETVDSNGRVRVFVREEDRKFGYTDTGKNEKDEDLELDLFQNALNIDFRVVANILAVYDKNGKEIEKEEWFNFGIL